MLTRAAAKRRMKQIRNNAQKRSALKKYKIEKKDNDKYCDKELLVKWFENLNESKVDSERIIVQENTVKFVIFVCEKLQLDDEVLFLALDLVGKFRYCLKNKNMELEEPVLAIMVLVLISSKLAGQRQLLTITILFMFLQKLDIKKYTPAIIEKSERDIMNILKFNFPTSSILDDMNILIELFIKPSHFTVMLRPQCINLLRLLFINMDKMTNILEDCYNKCNKLHVLEELRKSKLYLPSGVVLCVVYMTEILKVQISYKNISTRMAKYINISLQNLDLLTKILHQLLYNKMQKAVN